ncbi:MAG: hypothetical protein ACC651_15940, partial [Candidatus Scalindua sp.]
FGNDIFEMFVNLNLLRSYVNIRKNTKKVIEMKRIELTQEEKEIEESLLKGEFVPIKGKQLEVIEKALKSRKKDVTMTIRVNSEDIEKIKRKAKKLVT